MIDFRRLGEKHRKRLLRAIGELCYDTFWCCKIKRFLGWVVVWHKNFKPLETDEGFQRNVIEAVYEEIRQIEKEEGAMSLNVPALDECVRKVLGCSIENAVPGSVRIIDSTRRLLSREIKMECSGKQRVENKEAIEEIANDMDVWVDSQPYSSGTSMRQIERWSCELRGL